MNHNHLETPFSRKEEFQKNGNYFERGHFVIKDEWSIMERVIERIGRKPPFSKKKGPVSRLSKLRK